MSGEREQASSLRGALCDVFFPALVTGELAELQKRIGDKATLAEPAVGASAGPPVREHVAKLETIYRGASYEKESFVAGTDRDVALGVLSRDGADTPVAVLAVRRKSREIDIRVYHQKADSSMPEVPADPRLTLPRPVGIFLDALADGDVDEALDLLSPGEHLRDGAGKKHERDSGAARAFLVSLGVLDCDPSGTADDGRTCAVEGMFVTKGVKRPGLIAFERSDNGMFGRITFYMV
jgi:hypothetical protein